MTSFNQNLGNFLTECRNDVLEQLKTDPRYSDWRRKRTAIRSQIEQKIGFELLEEYLEVVSVIHGIELNSALLCGLTTYFEIGKRFDSSSPEYREFTKEFVS